ncbi:peroxidase 51-like, partial [Cryptomeria japonica]|uniref:peroxidase 51-like n=1 Tax=Cryptomeria japonica TaxID=3369 RepID=UPI0027DA5AAB
QGCDASVMIQSTTNNSVEKDFQDNLSLVGDGFDTIVKAKQVVENMCPKTMSSVDILAIATRDVIQLVGGPRNSVELGRRNGLISQASRVNGNLPKGSFNLVQLVSLFRSKGLSPTDMIALSGVHTVGFSHCSQFSNRIYGNPVDPTLNPTYVSQLQSMCPRIVDPTIAIRYLLEDTVMGSDTIAAANGAIDVIAIAGGIAGLLGGMMGIVGGCAEIFSLDGVLAMVFDAAFIIKGDLFVVG